MSLRAVWRRLADGPDPRPRQALQGLVLGLLAVNAGAVIGLGLPWRLAPFTTPFYILCGVAMMLGPTWLRRAGWVALTALVTTTVLVAYTPLAPALLQPLLRDDGPAPADAIVVLSGATNTTSLTSSSQDRMLTGWRLLHDGWAPRLVYTGDPDDPHNQFNRMAAELQAGVGLPTGAVVPIEAVEAEVQTTYTEAMALRNMAADRQWRSLLLVTSPSHTRRAGAVFEAAGLQVRVVPSQVTRYDLAKPTRVSDRLAIFRDWVYESSAWLYYRLTDKL